MANTDFLPPSYESTVKIAVTAELGDGLHLGDVDVDFDVVVYLENNSSCQLAFNKAELIKIDNDTYEAIVDTTKVGRGRYWIKLTVLIPDNDVEDGKRKEVVKFPVKPNLNVVA